MRDSIPLDSIWELLDNFTLYCIWHPVVSSCHALTFLREIIYAFQHQFHREWCHPWTGIPLLPRNLMVLNSSSKTCAVVSCCLARMSGRRALIGTSPKATRLWTKSLSQLRSLAFLVFYCGFMPVSNAVCHKRVVCPDKFSFQVLSGRQTSTSIAFSNGVKSLLLCKSSWCERKSKVNCLQRLVQLAGKILWQWQQHGPVERLGLGSCYCCWALWQNSY